MKQTICHLTSVHSRFDIRIYHKMCCSLVKHGFAVTLIVADGKGEETINGVQIIDMGNFNGRLARMILTPQRMLRNAISLNADLYHLHDPELIPLGLRLHRHGKRVVFDSHEDIPKQILGKPYLNPISRKILSYTFSLYESYAYKSFDAIIAATPNIRDKFMTINKRCIDIKNYPIRDELLTSQNWENARSDICYVGGISQARGIREIVQAMENIRSNVRLVLAGNFLTQAMEEEVRNYQGWSQVDALGYLDRAGVRSVLGRSFAGLVTLHSTPNHIESLPIKMFEYMSVGIPVIASNFPLWKEIIQGNGCGICVNPLDPKSIAEAIDFLSENPEQAKTMGKKGRYAVENQFNWTREETNLLELYNTLLKN